MVQLSLPIGPRLAGLDWHALGCLATMVVTDPQALEPARAIAAEETASIDLACSRFRPDSELAALDQSAGRVMAISPLLVEAIDVALEAARGTDGIVDPTVGSAMVDLGYDRDFAAMAPTGPALRVVRRPVPGWQVVELDRDAGTLRVPVGVRLDLGATAKALCADRIARRVAELPMRPGVLVGLGGDLAVAGPAPRGGWAVQVQDVTTAVGEPVSGPTTVISLQRGGLATSSLAARRWVRGGRVMHHILDPRSGVPVVTPWRTVSVVAESCVAANVASTNAVVRGAGGLDWLRRDGSPARLVDHHGAVTVIGGWPADPVREVA
jgi:thiamine biosynthesis lipoprotein